MPLKSFVGDDDAGCILVWGGCTSRAAWASTSQRQGQSTLREAAAAGLDQSEASKLVDWASALIGTQARLWLAARGGRRRWTNGGRAGGQCLDSGAVFCLNSETVKAVCADWRGHYQARLLEEEATHRCPWGRTETPILILNQMTIGSQSSNALPLPPSLPTPLTEWASSCLSNPPVALTRATQPVPFFLSHTKL